MKTFKQFLNERLSSVKQTKLIDSEEICNASFNSNYIKVRELLEEGYNPNYKDSDNWTPLTIACKYTSDSEYYETAKVLLEYGADPKIKDKNGETALDIAKRYNNKEFIEYFG